MPRATLLALVLLIGLSLSSATYALGASEPAPPPMILGPTVPAKIEEPLRTHLETAPPDEPVEAVLHLAGRADLGDIAFRRGLVVDRLQTVADRSQEDLAAHLEASGLEVTRNFWIINAVLVKGTPSQILDATRAASVDRIIPNFEVEILGGPSERPNLGDQDFSPQASIRATYTWGLEKIRAPDVWSQVGVNGQGVRVCVSDTGVDIDHPDLAGKMWTDSPGDPVYPGGWIEFDSSGNPVAGSAPHDTQGHGTHTSGTALGADTSGIAIGVAPGANLMHALVLPGGSGSFSQVIAGIEWCVAPTDADGNPAGQAADVHSMSWGANGQYDDLIDPIRNSYFAGVIPVAAAGNCGDGCTGSPGNVFESLGIGASDVNDDIAGFSSGQLIRKTMWTSPPADWPDEWIVPDLSAPA